jgi:SAM-dependent methyltransferase
MGQNKTDWDKYYQKPYITARYSRKISRNRFFYYLKKYVPQPEWGGLRIAELGGAGSCYYDHIQEKLSPKKYIIIDNNRTGLQMMEEKIKGKDNVDLLDIDVLEFNGKMELDLVYSIGLIEHFPLHERQKVIRVHFDLLKPGGIAILSFPTPTFLYLMTRQLSKMLNLWIWHDEIPLEVDEVIQLMNPFGTVKETKILWPMILTQAMIVVQKFHLKGDSAPNPGCHAAD